MTYEMMLKVLRDMEKEAEGAEKEALSASITLVREKMDEKVKHVHKTEPLTPYNVHLLFNR